MDLKRLFDDDDAVSPVIGVILMVAITVILAAVIASFVLGLGQNTTSSAPQASFNFEYDSGGSTPQVTITHQSGDTIESANVYIRGNDQVATTGNWASIGGSVGSNSLIVAGNSVTIDVDAGSNADAWEIRVVYQSDGSSTTIDQASGPGA